MTPRSVALCWLASLGVVGALVVLLPRSFHANDDILLREYVRDGFVAPFISPSLSKLLMALYASWQTVPWYGLLLYAVCVGFLAVFARTAVALDAMVHPTTRAVRWAVRATAGCVLVGLAYLVIHPTFTIMGIAACGTGLLAACVELEAAHREQRAARWRRMGGAGALLAVGCAYRPDSVAAAVVAALPLLAWLAARMVRRRQRPGAVALLAFVAPVIMLLAANAFFSARHGAATVRFARFNTARGEIHGDARFAALHKRAPAVLEAAGWNSRSFVEFTSWLYLDEARFATERVEALAQTGGLRPGLGTAFTREAASSVVRAIGAGGALLIVLGALATWMCLLGWWQALALFLAAVTTLLASGLALQLFVRFPPRIALPMAVIAASSLLVMLGAEAGRRVAPLGGRRLRHTLGVVLLASAVAHLGLVIIPAVARHEQPSTAVIDRVAKRSPGALIVSHAMKGLNRDPLAARAAALQVVPLGWGIFSPHFYQTLRAYGVSRARDFWRATVDAPQIYFAVAGRYEARLNRYLRAAGGVLQEFDADAETTLYRVVSRPVAGAAAAQPAAAQGKLPATEQTTGL